MKELYSREELIKAVEIAKKMYPNVDCPHVSEVPVKVRKGLLKRLGLYGDEAIYFMDCSEDGKKYSKFAAITDKAIYYVGEKKLLKKNVVKKSMPLQNRYEAGRSPYRVTVHAVTTVFKTEELTEDEITLKSDERNAFIYKVCDQITTLQKWRDNSVSKKLLKKALGIDISNVIPKAFLRLICMVSVIRIG